jgi:lipopolysaccharide/colanic/teichoic acid biosynthesis glycosyltransferase
VLRGIGQMENHISESADLSVTTRVAKRLIDIVLGSLLLLVVLPAILLATIGCALSLRAWPFFTQTRMGRNGKPFRLVKLRTLPPQTPRYASKYELADLRVPRFTMALRRLHLDELPQLFLVVTGKMSLVGPRPEMGFLSAEYGLDFEAERTSVRPGCTGLWQVSRYSTSMIYEHPEFDRFYVMNPSVRLDLWIIGQTIRMMVSPRAEEHLVTLESLPAWAHRGPTVASAPAAVAPQPLPVVLDIRPEHALDTLQPVEV